MIADAILLITGGDFSNDEHNAWKMGSIDRKIDPYCNSIYRLVPVDWMKSQKLYQKTVFWKRTEKTKTFVYNKVDCQQGWSGRIIMIYLQTCVKLQYVLGRVNDAGC